MTKENNKKDDSSNSGKRYRSSVTGKFVKESYACKHPKTTTSEECKRSDPKDGTKSTIRHNHKK